MPSKKTGAPTSSGFKGVEKATNIYNGTVINNDNSRHTTYHGPVYNNFGQQTINQVRTYNGYGNNPYNFSGEVADYCSFVVSANIVYRTKRFRSGISRRSNPIPSR